MNYKAVLKDHFDMCHENAGQSSQKHLLLFLSPLLEKGREIFIPLPYTQVIPLCRQSSSSVHLFTAFFGNDFSSYLLL